jgi:hypothetical protein
LSAYWTRRSGGIAGSEISRSTSPTVYVACAIEKLAKCDRRTIAGWLKIVAEDAVAAAGGTKKR